MLDKSLKMLLGHAEVLTEADGVIYSWMFVETPREQLGVRVYARGVEIGLARWDGSTEELTAEGRGEGVDFPSECCEQLWEGLCDAVYDKLEAEGVIS